MSTSSSSVVTSVTELTAVTGATVPIASTDVVTQGTLVESSASTHGDNAKDKPASLKRKLSESKESKGEESNAGSKKVKKEQNHSHPNFSRRRVWKTRASFDLSTRLADATMPLLVRASMSRICSPVLNRSTRMKLLSHSGLPCRV